MKLLTDALRAQIPPLYSSEKIEDPIVQCKFFDPCSNWTGYILEFDGEDLLFGLFVLHVAELGYMSLQEIECTRNPLGLHMERDLYFDPTPLSEVRRLHELIG